MVLTSVSPSAPASTAVCAVRAMSGSAGESFTNRGREVAARAPNLIILPSEPYEFGPEHAREIEAQVGGVPSVVVDGRDLFWWGIRTPEAAARIAAVLRDAAAG